MRLALRWPTFLAILCVLLNVDFVVMPALGMLVHLDPWGWTFFLIAATAGTVEALYQYWHAGWFARNFVKTEHAQRTAHGFRQAGLLGDIEQIYNEAKETAEDAIEWFVEHSRSQMELDTPAKQQLLKDALGIIQSTHIWMTYPVMIGLGIVPLGWAVAIVICRTHHVPGAFPLFLVVNAIKVWLEGVAYYFVPFWVKITVGLAFIAILIWRIRKWRRGRMATAAK